MSIGPVKRHYWNLGQKWIGSGKIGLREKPSKASWRCFSKISLLDIFWIYFQIFKQSLWLFFLTLITWIAILKSKLYNIVWQYLGQYKSDSTVIVEKTEKMKKHWLQLLCLAITSHIFVTGTRSCIIFILRPTTLNKRVVLNKKLNHTKFM